MPEIKPEHYITEEQCKKLIDQAIDKHNKTAAVISAAIGSVLLFFMLTELLQWLTKLVNSAIIHRKFKSYKYLNL